MKEFEYTLEELPKIIEALFPIIESQKVILMIGEMGAGKTTFVSQLCQLWGVKDEVSSPTFALVNEYLLDDDHKILHLDLYRVSDIEELLQMGFEDILDQDVKHVFIEWPQIAEDFLPEHFVLLKFEKIQDAKRLLKVKVF